MIGTRYLNYRMPACRQAMIFVKTKFCHPNNSAKIVYPLYFKRNLYESVKKRALEARSKLKKTDYPYSRPCGEPSFTEKDPPYKKPKSKPAKEVKESACKPSSCKPPPGAGASGGSGSSGSKSGETTIKCFLVGLATAALGGLAWYLLKSDDDKTCPEVVKVVEAPKVEQRSQIGGRVPPNSNDLPSAVPYLLVGGGAASFSAFRAIKSNDPKAKVLVISNELYKPYMRPPLSKELWYSTHPGEVSKDFRFKQWTGADRSLFFEPDEFFIDPTKLIENENGGIAVAQGYSVKKIDAKHKIAILEDGTEIKYGKCLLATGCSPKNLPVFENAPKNVQNKIMFYRSPNDFQKLKNLVDQGKSVTIIGNGFLGSELSCSLSAYSKDKKVKIYQIYPESGNMSKVLPEYLSKWTTHKVEQMGVCVVPEVQVKEVHRERDGLQLALTNGQTILTDVVVVCIGCEANTNIATLSGLEVDGDLGGFVVNAELEARQDLFVAGDASCFYDPLLGRRRLEHHDHSVISGRLAGENMVVGKDGKKKPYEHQSMFWSDLGPKIGYEAIGRIEAGLPTVGVFALDSGEVRKDDHLDPTAEKNPPLTVSHEHTEKDTKQQHASHCDGNEYQKGVIFYLQNDKIVGILLWNIFNRVGLARTIINQNKSYKDLNEVAKLFEIHS